MFKQIANILLDSNYSGAGKLAKTLIKTFDGSTREDFELAFRLIEVFVLESAPQIISRMSPEIKENLLIDRLKVGVDDIAICLLESLRDRISGKLLRNLLRHFDNTRILACVAQAPTELLYNVSPQILVSIIKLQLKPYD